MTRPHPPLFLQLIQGLVYQGNRLGRIALGQAKLANFPERYLEVVELPELMLKSMLDLMIEIMIAEAVLPIAATGYFGHHSGLEFLQMIHRKCDWIDQNRKSLLEVIFHQEGRS